MYITQLYYFKVPAFSAALLTDPSVWFRCQPHALEVKPLLTHFTFDHPTVVAFRETTCTVHLNEQVLQPTSMNWLVCWGERTEFFTFKALFKVCTHFVWILRHHVSSSPGQHCMQLQCCRLHSLCSLFVGTTAMAVLTTL